MPDKVLSPLTKALRKNLLKEMLLNEKPWIDQVNNHPYQKLAFESDKQFVILVAGVQAGKTQYGVGWLVNEAEKNPGGSFLMANPTYKMMQQSTLDKFKNMVDPLKIGYFGEMKSTYFLNNQGKIFVRSTDDPDLLEGITAGAIWLDEAGKMPREVWVNVLGRLSVTQGRCLITTSLYSFNWLNELINAYNDPEDVNYEFLREHFDIFVFESIKNPAFPQETLDIHRRILTPVEFDRKYKAILRPFEGLVYEMDNKRNIVNAFPKQFKEIVAGVDFGFNNPTAIIVLGITNDDTIYVMGEFYKPLKAPSEVVVEAKKMKKAFDVSYFYCDSHEPGLIEELNRGAIPSIPNDKAVTVKEGIARVNQFITTGKMKVFESLRETRNEFSLYHYRDTDNPKLKEEPAKQYDHAMDAIRYAIITHNIKPAVTKEKDTRDPIWKYVDTPKKGHHEEMIGGWNQDGF